MSPAAITSADYDGIVFGGAIIGLAYVGLWVSIIIHELGHVIGALVCRMKILEISFGKTSRSLIRTRGIQIRLGLFPVPGYVRTKARSLKWYSQRIIIMVAFGPLFTVCYQLVLCSYLRQPNVAFGALGFSPLWILLVANSAILLSSILPGMVSIPGGKIGSDGLQIWRILTRFALPSPIRRRFTQTAFGKRPWKTGRSKGKAPALPKAPIESLQPKEQVLCLRFLLTMEEWARIKSITERILADPSIPNDDPIRWQAADSYASAVLYGEDRDSVPRALELLESVIKVFPKVVTLRGSLGALMFELGRLDEAELILKEVVTNSNSLIDHGICSAYLSRIANHRGMTVEAQNFGDAARKTPKMKVIVNRILSKSEDGDS